MCSMQLDSPARGHAWLSVSAGNGRGITADEGSRTPAAKRLIWRAIPFFICRHNLWPGLLSEDRQTIPREMFESAQTDFSVIATPQGQPTLEGCYKGYGPAELKEPRYKRIAGFAVAQIARTVRNTLHLIARHRDIAAIVQAAGPRRLVSGHLPRFEFWYDLRRVEGERINPATVPRTINNMLFALTAHERCTIFAAWRTL